MNVNMWSKLVVTKPIRSTEQLLVSGSHKNAIVAMWLCGTHWVISSLIEQNYIMEFKIQNPQPYFLFKTEMVPELWTVARTMSSAY